MKGALVLKVVSDWSRENLARSLSNAYAELSRCLTELENVKGQVTFLQNQLEEKADKVHTREEMADNFQYAMAISRRCYAAAFPDLPLPYSKVMEKYDEDVWLEPLEEEIAEEAERLKETAMAVADGGTLTAVEGVDPVPADVTYERGQETMQQTSATRNPPDDEQTATSGDQAKPPSA